MGRDGSVFERGKRYLHENARLLERRLFACHFEDGDPELVATAVRAYQNPDGGFGFGIEADLLAPTSQPIHVELALQALRDAGARDDGLVARACAFLDSVANDDGAVSPALPGATQYPCADHWRIDAWALQPDVNPTAAIAAHARALGATHPWVDRATAWCREAIATRTFKSAHTLLAALRLVEDDAELRTRVLGQLEDAEWFTLETPITRYTLTPLHFAPTPNAPARAFFADDVIEAHLDDLLARQQEDGGWPVLWKAPGPAAVCAWRGRWTLDALVTLRAYGRL